MLRVYVDTSVIGGCFDKEFSPWSRQLLQEFRKGVKIPVIADLTLQELEKAPEEVRAVLKEITDRIETVYFNDEATILAQTYLDENIVTKNTGWMPSILPWRPLKEWMCWSVGISNIL